MSKASKVASKAAGKAKGAAKAMAGYPGIFHHLAGEHAEVATMMKRVSSGDSDTREELFPEIRRSLLAHAQGEEEEFYPQLRRYSGLEPMVSRSLQEHQEVKAYLDDLNSSDKSTDSWKQRFEQMMHAVEAHVDLEENELFPKANELINGEQADDMLERYEEVEERSKMQM